MSYWSDPKALRAAIIEIAYAGAGEHISTEFAEALAEQLFYEDDKTAFKAREAAEDLADLMPDYLE